MNRPLRPSYMYSPPEKKKKRFLSASKLIIFSFILMYYIGFGVATKTVLQDSMQLHTYLAYIGAPIAIIVPFYLNKSKAENTAGGVVYDAVMHELNNGGSSRG
jgi:hypothetical protein